MIRKGLQKLWNWYSEGVWLRWGHMAARKTYVHLPTSPIEWQLGVKIRLIYGSQRNVMFLVHSSIGF